jgi:hypothetical protein
MIEKLPVVLLTLVCVAVYLTGIRRDNAKLTSVALNLFVAYAIAWVMFMAYVWVNHINFPLNLEAMELTIVQHFQRAVAGQPIYVDPSPDFVPFAYAPLYYYFSVPFAWLFGANLFTLRLVAILGMLGAELVIFFAVKKQTRSMWWGIIAVGLFAAAYRVMDTYLDNAHSDSWLLFCALLGSYLISLNKSRTVNFLGVFVLIVSFWFKQHGALFAVGGVLYLTWRDGVKSSILYWVTAGLLGPVLYLLAPTLFFGPQFRYYTLTIPSHWSELNFDAIKRYLGFIIKSYLALAGVGASAALLNLFKQKSKISIWYFMLPFAMLSGFMGALDPGSNNNVFIPMGTWFIITGVLGAFAFAGEYPIVNKWALHLAVLGLSFALFFYKPASVLVSPQADEAYQDLVGYLNSLDGPVYAPWIGQLQNGYTFSPSVHWVPMEDLIRGQGVDTYNHPNTRMLLDSVIHPNGTAYILMNYPLENDPLLSFLLAEGYTLESDLGGRFSALTTLPKRYNLEYPRYLYKYQP